MHVIRAPEPVPMDLPRPWLFLAGSIEQGVARDWQADLLNELADEPGTVLSPRRVQWDASWPQDPDFPPFREQVLWELANIDAADIVLFHFEAETLSPITLLELGLRLASGRSTVISCNPDFWRYGNVRLTAETFGVPVHHELTDAVVDLRARVRTSQV